MSTTTTASVRDEVIREAQSLPDLIQKASVLDPVMAATLTGQAQTASKTPLGSFLAAGVALLASHYGLAWGEGTDSLIAGAALLAGGYATHWWQARSTGLMPVPSK